MKFKKISISLLLFQFFLNCSTFTEINDKYQELRKYQKEYKQARRKNPQKPEEEIRAISCPYIQNPYINRGEPLYSCPSSEYQIYWTIQKECYCIPTSQSKDIPTLKEILRDFYY